MSLLLDQNISFRVIPLLTDKFEGIKQVKQVGLTDANDAEIWNYALHNNFTIVTFDSDFIDLATLKGVPPKIIWLRFGNSSNQKIAKILLEYAEIIKEFIADNKSNIKFLEID